MMRILSLGDGVQSTTLALMSERGEIPPIDCAIFADTQSEPEAVALVDFTHITDQPNMFGNECGGICGV